MSPPRPGCVVCGYTPARPADPRTLTPDAAAWILRHPILCPPCRHRLHRQERTP